MHHTFDKYAFRILTFIIMQADQIQAKSSSSSSAFIASRRRRGSIMMTLNQWKKSEVRYLNELISQRRLINFYSSHGAVFVNLDSMPLMDGNLYALFPYLMCVRDSLFFILFIFMLCIKLVKITNKHRHYN